MLDVHGQRSDIFVNVVISIASTGALKQQHTNDKVCTQLMQQNIITARNISTHQMISFHSSVVRYSTNVD